MHQHDQVTGSGSLLLDDGSPLAYDGAAFAAGGARLFRTGQRVTLVLDGDRVVRVELPTRQG